ncbi:MAG: hypothetical protein ACK5MS_07180 [Planctomyces sp.]
MQRSQTGGPEAAQWKLHSDGCGMMAAEWWPGIFMRRIRLGAGILNQTPLDWQGNAQRICQALD